jgi:hypothetical protein
MGKVSDMRFSDSMAIATKAQQLVTVHGERATTIAVGEASRMEMLGDAEGRTGWLCVMISAQQMLLSQHGW